MVTTLFAWAAVLLGASTDDARAPWASNHHASDVVQQHVQAIAEGRAEYVVVQKGTMDGWNCRSPQGVWQPFEQTWESNRSVRLENVGTTDVVNPWLSNGRNDFRGRYEVDKTLPLSGRRCSGKIYRGDESVPFIDWKTQDAEGFTAIRCTWSGFVGSVRRCEQRDVGNGTEFGARAWELHELGLASSP